MTTDRKTAILGMPIGTATARLRKSLLFAMARRLELTQCHACGREIETLGEFSIEHKLAWQGASDPAAAFFDLENIAFSHLRCNVAAAVKLNRKWTDLGEYRRESFKRYYAKPEKREQFLARKRERYKNRQTTGTW